MICHGWRIGVAVSGGADSVALLHVLHAMSAEGGFSLMVLHLNHQLRGVESDLDEQFVKGLAASLGIPCVSEKVTLGDGNLEQAGRYARKEFFSRCVVEWKLDRVALGHTRSDQAETVLFRMLRGSGPTGLAAILPVTREKWIRPLIEVGRDEVRQYLVDRGIAWREDSSNRDMRFSRNRIRRLMPELARDFNPRLEVALARLADISREEENFWDVEVTRLDAIHNSDGAVLVRLEKIAKVHTAVVRRLMRRAIALVKGDLHQIALEHVDRVVTLARGNSGGGRVELPGGLEVWRSFDQLRIGKGRAAVPAAVPVKVPGVTEFGGCQIDVEASGQVMPPLTLRGWRAGDRFWVEGTPGPEKLRTLLQEARVPSWDRPLWPIITDGETILWTRRFGVAHGFRLRVREVQEM